MEEEGVDARFEFEERDGRRLKYYAGEPGNYVGVTEYKGKRGTTYHARASITKRKGDARRQYHIKPRNGDSGLFQVSSGGGNCHRGCSG